MIKSPTTALVTLATLVKSNSTLESTVTLSLVLLTTVSLSLLLANTVLDKLPATVTLTTKVTVTDLPAATLEIVQVALREASTYLSAPDTYFTPAGKTSQTLTPTASDKPSFLTVIVYLIKSPTTASVTLAFLEIFNLTSGLAVTLVLLTGTSVTFSVELATTALATVPLPTTLTVNLKVAEAPLPARVPTFQTLVTLFQLPVTVSALVTTTRPDNFSVTLTLVAVELPLLVTVIT